MATRATWSLTFEPYADGIFPNIIGDQDDYPVTRPGSSVAPSGGVMETQGVWAAEWAQENGSKVLQ